MKNKMLMELFVYIIIVIIGTIMLFTYQPKVKEIKIPISTQTGGSK
ncbi:MAG: hypothetical protein MJA82_09555 [Clostridia bacterium]|nr:hypothetical protein [Clostridia bacterium]